MHFEYFLFLCLVFLYTQICIHYPSSCSMLCLSALLLICCLFICFYFHFAVSSKISNKTKRVLARDKSTAKCRWWLKGGKKPQSCRSVICRQSALYSCPFVLSSWLCLFLVSSDLFCLLLLPGHSFCLCALLFLRFGTCNMQIFLGSHKQKPQLPPVTSQQPDMSQSYVPSETETERSSRRCLCLCWHVAWALAGQPECGLPAA